MPASVWLRGKEFPLFDEKQLSNLSRANLKQRAPPPNWPPAAPPAPHLCARPGLPFRRTPCGMPRAALTVARRDVPAGAMNARDALGPSHASRLEPLTMSSQPEALIRWMLEARHKDTYVHVHVCVCACPRVCVRAARGARLQPHLLGAGCSPGHASCNCPHLHTSYSRSLQHLRLQHPSPTVAGAALAGPGGSELHARPC